MRSVIMAATILIVACGEKVKNATNERPSFVSFQLRSAGVPANPEAPNTLAKAMFRIAECSNEKDNRIIQIDNFAELHTESLSLKSTGCRLFLDSFTLKNSKAETVFTPQSGMHPMEVVTGNSSTYISPSLLKVIVEIEKGLSQTLQFKENISIALLPMFGTKTISAKVTVEDFLLTDPDIKPAPALSISKVEYAGVLTASGLYGYSLQLACTELLNGTNCSNMDLMEMRFRQLNEVPVSKSRVDLITLIEERPTQIIPNSTHLWVNGLQFTITTPNKPGEHIFLLAAFQDSVRLFDIEIPANP